MEWSVDTIFINKSKPLSKSVLATWIKAHRAFGWALRALTNIGEGCSPLHQKIEKADDCSSFLLVLTSRAEEAWTQGGSLSPNLKVICQE